MMCGNVNLGVRRQKIYGSSKVFIINNIFLKYNKVGFVFYLVIFILEYFMIKNVLYLVVFKFYIILSRNVS